MNIFFHIVARKCESDSHLTGFKFEPSSNLTKHKKTAFVTVAGAAVSLVLTVSAEKRRVVKRFFVYRPKIKKLKFSPVTARQWLAVCKHVFIYKTQPRGNRPLKKRSKKYAHNAEI